MKASALRITGIYLFLTLVFPARACSTIHVTVNPESNSKDANVTVIGRSMEEGYRLLLSSWEIFVVPRQSPKFHTFFTSLTDKKQGNPSVTNSSPYNPKTKGNSAGFVVISVPVTFFLESRYPLNILCEGQNEFGLSISAQTFQSSLYQKNDGENDDFSNKEELAWFDVVPYLLGSFTNAEEAIDALREKVVVTRPNRLRTFGMHWTLDDAKGGHYVIEYLDNQLVTYGSRLGVLTNDPSFSWQVENLNNYGNIQADIPTVQIHPKKQPTGIYPRPFEKDIPEPFSHGSGQLGIPGDGSPPSRFVRLFYLRGLAQANSPPGDLTEALALATNLLDAVSIPYGSSTGKSTDKTCPKTDKSAKPVVHSLENLFHSVELQQWCVLKVPSRGLFYYRDYVNSAWKVIDFKKQDFSEGAPMKSIKLHDRNEPFAQSSPLMKESK